MASEKLIVGVGADLTDFTRGMQQTARSLQNFGSDVAKVSRSLTFPESIAALKQLGIQAKGLADISGGLTKISVAAADVEGATSILRRLGSAATIVAAEEAKMARAVTGTTATLAAHTAAVRTAATATTALATTTSLWAGSGQRAANTAVAVAFGLEAIARGGDAAEGGIRMALRSVAGLSAAFGPKGLIVSGAAVATAAIIDLFKRTREESEKTAKAFLADVSAMVRAGDQLGLVAKARDLEIGFADAGAGLGGGFAGSLRDLNAQLANTRTRIAELSTIKSVFTPALVKPLEDEVKRLEGLIGPIQKRFDDLRKRILNPPEVPRDIQGLVPVVINARAIQEQIKAIGPIEIDLTPNIVDIRDMKIPKLSQIAMPPKMESEAKIVNSVLDRANVAIQEMITGLDGVSGGFSGVGRSAAQALGQVSGMISAIQQSRKAVEKISGGAGGKLDIAGIAGFASAAAGIIGGVAQLASALFGQSELVRKQQAVLSANNERLKELRLGLDGFRITAGSTAVAGKAAASISGNSQLIKQLDFFAHAAGSAASDFGLQMGVLNPVLKTLGISFAQLNAIAKENDIGLLDDQGRIVAGAFAQLTERLGITIADLTKFGTSLADQRGVAELRANIFDLDASPVATLQRELALLTQFESPFAALFAGVDAATVEGRAIIEDGIRKIFNIIDADMLTADQLGELGSLDELVSIITNTEGALDSFTETTRQAESALRNVPQGFKIAAARFAATAAEIQATSPADIFAQMQALQPPVIAMPSSFGDIAKLLEQLRTPSIPSAMGGVTTGTIQDLLGQLTAAPRTGGGGSFNVEQVIIEAGNRDGKQIYEEFMAEARRRARAQFGDTSRWSDIP